MTNPNTGRPPTLHELPAGVRFETNKASLLNCYESGIDEGRRREQLVTSVLFAIAFAVLAALSLATAIVRPDNRTPELIRGTIYAAVCIVNVLVAGKLKRRGRIEPVASSLDEVTR